MDKALAVWHWFATVGWPWFVVIGPSVVTALTKYPKAGGVVKVIKTALDLGSVLTHKDSPGTLKAPILSLSSPPPAAKPALTSVPNE